MAKGFADSFDGQINRPVTPFIIQAPDFFNQLFAAEGLIGVAGQKKEEGQIPGDKGEFGPV